MIGDSVGISTLVKETFFKLDMAQKDLKSDGLDLPALPYDQALELINLLKILSKQKRIILVLDAWEKADSVKNDYSFFDSLLGNRNDWHSIHFILAIRNPSLMLSENLALNSAKVLKRKIPSVDIVEIPEMDLSDKDEKAEVLSYLRSEFSGLEKIPDEKIFEMISGYPGVLNFWLDGTSKKSLFIVESFQQKANDAQQLRYIDLEHKISALGQREQALVGRLVFLPRLDSLPSWLSLKPIVLSGLDEESLDSLIDDGVLIIGEDDIPTLGHDTRHSAGLRWFSKNTNRVYERSCNRLIKDIVLNICSLEDRFSIGGFYEISACINNAELINLSEDSKCLIAAVQCAKGNTDLIRKVNFDEYYKNAITIKENEALGLLFSVAIYNRAIQYFDEEEYQDVIDDMNEILKFPNLPDSELIRADYMKAQCYQGLDGPEDLKKSALVRQNIIDKYSKSLSRDNKPYEEVLLSYLDSGLACIKEKQYKNAIEQFDNILNLKNKPSPWFEWAALYHKSEALFLFEIQYKSLSVINELLKLFDEKAVANYWVCNSLILRSNIYYKNNDCDLAIEDLTRILDVPSLHLIDRFKAYILRGKCYLRIKDIGRGSSDLTFVNNHPEAPSNLKHEAFKAFGEIQFNR